MAPLHFKVPVQVVLDVLHRLEDLKLDEAILKKYAEEAKELGDESYYQAVLEGIRDNTKNLKHTRRTLQEIKNSYRTRTGD